MVRVEIQHAELLFEALAVGEEVSDFVEGDLRRSCKASCGLHSTSGTIPNCSSHSLLKDRIMAKNQTRAVRKIEKAVRKAVKKGVTEGAVEKAVSQGMAKGTKKKSAASAKADLRAAKAA